MYANINPSSEKEEKTEHLCCSQTGANVEITTAIWKLNKKVGIIENYSTFSCNKRQHCPYQECKACGAAGNEIYFYKIVKE